MLYNNTTTWMNWVLTGSILLCIPLLYTTRTHFNRLALDEVSNSEGFLIINEEDGTSSSSTASPPYSQFSPVLGVTVHNGLTQRRTSSTSQQDAGYCSATVKTPVEVHSQSAVTVKTENQAGSFD